MLRPDHTPGATVEYGDGAQNVSRAFAALSVFNPESRPPTGASERLGNLIDSWYFAAIGWAPAQSHLISLTCGMEPCFARFLASRLDRISVTPTQKQAAINEQQRHMESWGLYTYPTIRALMPQLRHDLRAAMKEYAGRFDTSLAHPQYEGGATHLIVHYRLGDFVTNSWCIPPADVAAAAASLHPSVIEIMDGGVRHLDQVDGYSAVPHRANRTRQQQALHLSAELQSDLEGALRAAVPSARITRTRAASIDADWFRIAHAPLLVTSAGSFAVTAAIAGYAEHVRTPAADNLNYPDRSTREVEQMAPNWQTYAYDLHNMRGR